MNSELKPCPFCGGGAAIGRISEGYTYIYCWWGCSSRTAPIYGVEHAIAVWNTRAIEDDLVEALQKAAQRLEIIQDTIKEEVIDRLHAKQEISLEGITTEYARIADTLLDVMPILDGTGL
jgi:hypothetical protein